MQPIQNYSKQSQPSCYTFFSTSSKQWLKDYLSRIAPGHLSLKTTSRQPPLLCLLLLLYYTLLSPQEYHAPLLLSREKFFLLIVFHLLHNSWDSSDSCIVRICEYLFLVAIHYFKDFFYVASNCYSSRVRVLNPLYVITIIYLWRSLVTLPSTFSCPTLHFSKWYQ